MSDEAGDLQPAVAADGVTAGTMLRRAREASGLHVAALAVSLKVPVRKVEALEDDRYADVGDVVFIRGLASSVCRALKVDPRPILERLPQTAAPRLVRDTDGLNSPFRAPSDGPAPRWSDRVSQPVPIAVAAILVGAVVVYFLPSHPFGEGASVAVPNAATPAAPALPTLVQAPAPAAVPAPAPAPALESAVSVQPPAPAPSPALASAPAVVATAAAPAAAASKPVEAAAMPSQPASGTVVIRAKGESWVEVTDAKGAVALRKILTPGEAAGASGALPLQVTIGRVNQTEVTVRGQPFDMGPVSKDNVARFVVK